MFQHELQRLIAKFGLSHLAEELLELALPAAGVRYLPLTPEAIRPGQSRTGGVPDVPPDFVWPEHEGESLMFLAQYNLDEVRAAFADAYAPSSQMVFELDFAPPPDLSRSPLSLQGLLSVFYQFDMSTEHPPNRGSWRVLYYEGDCSLLAPASPPSEPRAYDRFSTLSYRACWMLPSSDSPLLDYLNLAPEDQRRYKEMIEDLLSMQAPWMDMGDHLLGYPLPVQDEDMMTICRRVSNGVPYTRYPHSLLPEAERRIKPQKWRSLLEFSDFDQSLFFWIEEDDLFARRFENVLVIAQCS